MIITVKQLKDILNLHKDDDEVFVANPSPDNSIYSIIPAKSQLAILVILHKEDAMAQARFDVYIRPI